MLIIHFTLICYTTNIRQLDDFTKLLQVYFGLHFINWLTFNYFYSGTKKRAKKKGLFSPLFNGLNLYSVAVAVNSACAIRCASLFIASLMNLTTFCNSCCVFDVLTSPLGVILNAKFLVKPSIKSA